MKNFAETTACLQEVHCITCRNRENGYKFRESLSKAFKLPNDEINFECPYGKEWEHKSKSKGLGDTLKKAIEKVTLGKVKPCGGCKKRQEKLNKLFPYK